MSSYGFLLLCIQACLIQNAFSACLSGPLIPGLPAPIPYGPSATAINTIDLDVDIFGLGAAGGLGGLYLPPLALGGASAAAAANAAAAASAAAAAGVVPGVGLPGYPALFGGVGEGEISAGGLVNALGTSLVSGSVPVIGSVAFDGPLPATGAVILTGNCGCAPLL